MVDFKKFNKGAPTKKTTPTAPAKRASKFGGAKESQDRTPIPVAGVYRFRVLSNVDEPSPENRTISWFKAQLEIVELDGAEAKAAHNVGDTVTFLQQTAGGGAEKGLGRTVTYVRHAAGYELREEWDAFDPDGYFTEAVGGTSNEYSEAGLSIVGRLVDCRVSRGRPKNDDPSDYYRNWDWSIVSEDEQDVKRPELG